MTAEARRAAWGLIFAACSGANPGDTGGEDTSGSDAVGSSSNGGDGTSGAGASTTAPPTDEGTAMTTSTASAGESGLAETGAPDCEGDSIVADADTWTFVPVDGSVCATPGTTAGIFVNPTARGDRLLVFLAGGGACFSEDDCGAANLEGFDPDELMADVKGRSTFDRQSPVNPFADFDFVYVPYCTGDLHSGDGMSDFGLQHRGFANIGLYLERIVPTFCEASHVVLAGTSAGGFGATFNYDRVHAAFGSTSVDLIDDSGPYLPPPYMPLALQADLDATWGFAANLPADCEACASGWHALFDHLAASWPDDRLSIISSLRDPSIQGRFAPYGALDDLDTYTIAMNDLADGLVGRTNLAVFYLPIQGHVWLNGAQIDQLVVDDISLAQFIRAQIDDDPAWQSARP